MCESSGKGWGGLEGWGREWVCGDARVEVRLCDCHGVCVCVREEERNYILPFCGTSHVPNESCLI